MVENEDSFGKEVATVKNHEDWIDGREVSSNNENVEALTHGDNVSINDESPMLEVMGRGDNPESVVISFNTLVVWLLKPLIGLGLIIGFGVVFLSAWLWAPWFLLGIFTGVYLLMSTLLNLFIKFTSGKLSWSFMRTNYILDLPLPFLWFTLEAVFSVALLICACCVIPSRWTFGHIAGIIVAILMMLKAVVSVIIWRKYRDDANVNSARRISASLMHTLNQLVEAGSSQQLPTFMSQAVKQWTQVWKGFNDTETTVGIMKGKRFEHFLILLLALILCVISCVTEVCFIKGWDSYNNHPNHAHFWVYGPLGVIETSMRYWAGISTVSCIPLLILLMAGSFRPSLLLNIIMTSISLSVGVYFALLSFYSTMSLMLLQEKLVHGPALIFRCSLVGSVGSINQSCVFVFYREYYALT